MADLVSLGGGVFIAVFMAMTVIQACVTIRKEQ